MCRGGRWLHWVRHSTRAQSGGAGPIVGGGSPSAQVPGTLHTNQPVGAQRSLMDPGIIPNRHVPLALVTQRPARLA